jgi:hypothetical protein
MQRVHQALQANRIGQLGDKIGKQGFFHHGDYYP